MERKRIYLDYQATTPIDPRVLLAMRPFFEEKFGNPHSQHHYGWEAADPVELARNHIASLINANPREIVFTSGATESNNLAIKGLARFFKGEKRHLITCVTEHKCVLEAFKDLENEGFETTYLSVKRNGLINVNHLRKAIRKDTLLVSVMGVNNEIGVIQPLRQIGNICRKAGIYFHSDCAQALGKISLDTKDLQVDLMSLSSHKVYGPKGIGALYIRRKPRVRILPLISGGGQENGLRSGTLPTPLCVGFGEACKLAKKEMKKEDSKLFSYRKILYDGITQKLPGVTLNGDYDSRISGNLNLSFKDVDGETLIASLKNICVSSGSACTEASLEPSYVLDAMGVSKDLAQSSLRIGFGRFTSLKEIKFACNEIVKNVNRIRGDHPTVRERAYGRESTMRTSP
jgi:cysteine desulfurase